MSDNHPTPQWLKQHFEDWFDPCPLNNGELREFDGLGDWEDKSFVNMPYSKPIKWVERAIKEAEKGKRVVLLTRVDTSTKWWIKLVEAGFRVAFFNGRIKFSGEGSPNFASAIWFSQ